MELEKPIKQDVHNYPPKIEQAQEQQTVQIEFKQILQGLEDQIAQAFQNSAYFEKENFKDHHSIQMVIFKELRATEQWQQLQNETPMGIYNSIFPKKLIRYLIDQINVKMKTSFANQDEKQIRKKLVKIDQIFDFFGIKIIMGYIKMPHLEDYFNEKQLFQCKIFECFKEGRFKCLEQWSNFTDECLLKNINKAKPINEFQTIRVCKKIGKTLRNIKTPGKDLILQVNSGFIIEQSINSQQIMICDPKSKLIVWQYFCNNIQEEKVGLQIVHVLQQFKDNNHTLYIYDNILNLEQIAYLKIKLKIQCVQKLDSIQASQVPQIPLYLDYMSIIKEQNEVFAVTSGEQIQQLICTYNQYKETMLLYCIHKFRPNFSYIHYSSAIMTELQEITIWNSYQIVMKLKASQHQQTYEQFRLGLAQELLKNKITQIKNVPTLLHKQKVVNVALGTEIFGDYGQGTKINTKSLFHIPTIMATPKTYAGSMNCLVCKRNTQLITLCKPCSEISGKLVILCACDCFYLFHQNTLEYIINGEDVTQTQYKSIEQSSQQLYHQAFQQKPGLMYENVDKGKSVQYAKQVEIE
ncbi:unnamed protein product (macronuclear) [Paramecium tetraurelia]|uniref:PiggyBac transposable element-derived protein domain-containing protein n=1 Tax=Paramecium tetraurelia TaxID=5888 RepID=A0BIY7_PARTE|nr:uncharacterized protein GSPATT00004877001 [Paramecium tetraurelia]CAK58504.1 unnamed protein product [Paramecium tetraurelia]|eukprot:XP_001425902.1 hypothetical protein (macronuclear) [Paramecium tetraurelia strain d4-2]